MKKNINTEGTTHKSKYAILDIDPYLRPHIADINLRMLNYERMKTRLLGEEQSSLSAYANGHLFFGFHKTETGWVYREWAPAAKSLHIFGDFNGWNRLSHPLKSIDAGIWEIEVEGEAPHESKVRIILTNDNEVFERIPLYAKRAVQNPANMSYDGQIWLPPEEFVWTDQEFKPNKKEPVFIYETHVGMSGEKEGVTSYNEFTDVLLPRIKKLGYNTVQLMAIMEHPYYGSFGYQVSNFFAVSSRFGTPEELKRLINTAHDLGISVLLDLIHSHAAGNEIEGIARFDGTEYQFFHTGPRGVHPQWDSKLFNYGNPGVIHFLLSNLKYWLEEYHFDGFRFDGITSMLYMDHALGGIFDHYGMYFSMNTDTDAVTYLQLASELCKEVKPTCVLVAEDMSGMPGMCLPIKDGGIGFDYRLGMGLPDFWIGYLKKRRDEDWDMGSLWYELTQRRPMEKVIGYAESHDQALVGDKTIIFWLADKEMYWHMNKDSENLQIDRAMALHKMIRLITCSCGGEGYLNFMGNEFGHPEWIDFPRAGNDNSYKHARRQWSLADNSFLRYESLQAFDIEMVKLIKKNKLCLLPSELIYHHEDGKILIYRKGKYVFCFNFHPVNDFESVIHTLDNENWTLVLHSSWPEFGGHRPHDSMFLREEVVNKHIYMDKRSALVFKSTNRRSGKTNTQV